MRKLFRRRWLKALAIALTLVVLPFAALWWLSTGADRKLQAEKDKLSALGFPMTLEDQRGYFERKGKNGTPLLNDLASRYEQLGIVKPLPGEDSSTFLKKFGPLRDEFLKVTDYETFYEPEDWESSMVNAFAKITPVMEGVLVCAMEACKGGDVPSALRMFDAADHYNEKFAGRGMLLDYILALGDRSRVSAAYAKCVQAAKTNSDILALIRHAKNRSGPPPIEAAFPLEPFDQIKLFESPEMSKLTWETFKDGPPEDEEGWVYTIPHLRKRVIAEKLSVWTRFIQNFPADKTDWKAYSVAYERSYSVLEIRKDRIARVALTLLLAEELASKVYAKQLFNDKAYLMGMRILGGIPHEPELDIFTDKPLKVRQDKLGIIIYGVGPNQVDDNGTGDDVRVTIRF